MKQPARLRILAGRRALEARDDAIHFEPECLGVPPQAVRVRPVSQDEGPNPQLVGNCCVVRLLRVPLDDFVPLIRGQSDGGLSCRGKCSHPRLASLPFCRGHQAQLHVRSRPWTWESLFLPPFLTFRRTPPEPRREQDIRPGV